MAEEMKATEEVKPAAGVKSAAEVKARRDNMVFIPKPVVSEGFLGKFRKALGYVAAVLETLLAIVLVLGILFSFVQMPGMLKGIISGGSPALLDLVEYIALVIIAIEFIRIIICQNPDSVIEILMMAFTRELVIEDWEMWELLVGVIVFAGLFSIKMFLMKKDK